jgi:DNA-binding CsgD family transcriptional regulator
MGRQSPVRTAVIIEPARPAEIAPVILQAYGLTDRERKVTHLVLRGASTTAIADELCISPFTVQDHLKSIFEKMNLKSRGELAGRLFLDQYLPRLLSTSE